MTLLTLIIISAVLYGLIRATDARENHLRNRHRPKPASVSERRTWSLGGCRDCGCSGRSRVIDSLPLDVWLPHLCYECAELKRVNARIKHYEENNERRKIH